MIKKFKIFEKHYNIDPYGEEDWDDDNLSPLLKVAKLQNKPYDQITYLNCSYSRLTNLEGIENLVNLERLDCYYNQLTNLEGIENLVNLEELWCWDNLLTRLDGIENLVNLETLDCDSNRLTSLKEIENLVNLKSLHCSDNLLTDIDLEGIEDLYNIGINGMGLFDNLKNLKYLYLYSNNLSKKYKDYLKKKFKNINLGV